MFYLKNTHILLERLILLRSPRMGWILRRFKWLVYFKLIILFFDTIIEQVEKNVLS